MASLVPYSIGTDKALIVCIGVVAALPVLLRALRRQLDVFEPVVLTSAIFAVFYVFRPLYDISESYLFLGRDVSGGYTEALVAALVALVTFVCVYHLPLNARLAARIAPPPRPTPHQLMLVVGIACGLLSLVAFAALVDARGGWENVFQNRESGAFYEVAPVIAEMPIVAVPAIGLLWLARKRYGLLAIGLASIPFLMIMVLALPRGDRRNLLPLVTMLIVIYFVNRGRRPRVLRSLAVLLLVVVTVVRPLGDSRNGEMSYAQALGDSISKPASAFTGTIETQDTSIVTHGAMAIGVVGNEVPYRHGLEFASNTVLVAIPGELLPSKPEKSRTILVTELFGSCFAQCPTYGAITELYTDFGLASVIFGIALMAVLFSVVYRYYRRFPDDPLVRLGFALSVWVFFYPWWGGYGFVVLHGALVVGPVVLVGMLARRGD